MSVGTGSRNDGHRSPPTKLHQLTLKLHKEDWVLRKVRKGKLGLGSVNREYSELCGFVPYNTIARIHACNYKQPKVFPVIKRLKVSC